MTQVKFGLHVDRLFKIQGDYIQTNPLKLKKFQD